MSAIVIDSGLAEMQRMFTEAIFSDAAAVPAVVDAAPPGASRFDFDRNNVVVGLINAVAARYPVVRRLLWDDSFERVARRYVTAEPPRSPVLIEYGASFPRFLRKIGEGAAVDYLADVAELEAARTRAYHAADAIPLSKAAFSRLSTDQLVEVRVRLHPSVNLLKSRFPVISIWQANLDGGDSIITAWQQESALIARPHRQVEVWRLSSADYEFFAALSQGGAIGSAIARAAAQTADFDLAACFATLIAAEIVIGFDPPAGGSIGQFLSH